MWGKPELYLALSGLAGRHRHGWLAASPARAAPGFSDGEMRAIVKRKSAVIASLGHGHGPLVPAKLSPPRTAGQVYPATIHSPGYSEKCRSDLGPSHLKLESKCQHDL
jgi:hypothetical protein